MLAIWIIYLSHVFSVSVYHTNSFNVEAVIPFGTFFKISPYICRYFSELKTRRNISGLRESLCISRNITPWLDLQVDNCIRINGSHQSIIVFEREVVHLLSIAPIVKQFLYLPFVTFIERRFFLNFPIQIFDNTLDRSKFIVNRRGPCRINWSDNRTWKQKEKNSTTDAEANMHHFYTLSLDPMSETHNALVRFSGDWRNARFTHKSRVIQSANRCKNQSNNYSTLQWSLRYSCEEPVISFLFFAPRV